MGANARRRRERKSQSNSGQFRQLLENIDSASFNRMVRRECSECGSPDITWSTVGAVAEGPEPFRTHAREAVPVVGASADAWTCDRCGGFGAFEQNLHSSWDDLGEWG